MPLLVCTYIIPYVPYKNRILSRPLFGLLQLPGFLVAGLSTIFQNSSRHFEFSQKDQSVLLLFLHLLFFSYRHNHHHISHQPT